MPPKDLALSFEGKKKPQNTLKWLFTTCQSLDVVRASSYLTLKAALWDRKSSRPHLIHL